MLELRSVPADVIGCFGRPEALDALEANGDVGVRVAPDELLLLGRRAQLPELYEELTARDEHGLVMDLSGGFAIYTLRGDDRLEALARLSAIRVPRTAAVAQGLVAHVPAKLIVRADEVLVIVSSSVSHHLRERVLAACADLSPSEVRAGKLALAEAAL